MATKLVAIANQFSYEKSRDCIGRVIASAEALYLVPGVPDEIIEQKSATIKVNPGGAFGAGMAIASSDARRAAQKFRDNYSDELVDLDPLVTDEPEWPLKKGLRGIVLRREDVSRMKYPWWSALLINLGDRKAVIKPMFTSRSRVLTNLRELGWPI
jgi:hypothetical protein